MPPPNVTGSLHIGHALDNTLQDVVIRHARMRGKDACGWSAPTMPASPRRWWSSASSTARGSSAPTISREDFVDQVWEWKAQSRRADHPPAAPPRRSLDWANEQFTMDAHFSRRRDQGVRRPLQSQGLLYRAKRLVNWDPKFKTAISDLEVENREVQGHMWHFKYPLAGGETYTYVERDADGNVLLEEERDYIAIATTRPETMLGDGAVAVHPGDARYAPIVGKLCEIPVGPKEHRRLIPIITDDYPDPEFGSGAVKITGAHDVNDYGVAQRNGIPMYRLMDERRAMRTDGAPYAEAAARARGDRARRSRPAPRKSTRSTWCPRHIAASTATRRARRVVADIDAEGLMIAVEDKLIMQPFGDRGGVVIEPMLTDQWYVDAATLARPAIEAVRDGRHRDRPRRPGRRPSSTGWRTSSPGASRASCGGATGSRPGSMPTAMFSSPKPWRSAQQQAGDGVELTPGRGRPRHLVLLRPVAVRHARLARADRGPRAPLPQRPAHLRLRHPVLLGCADGDAGHATSWARCRGSGSTSTAWCATPDGQKMSKSKGNVVDPLGLIDKFGADALRFFMAAMESQGRDIKMDEKRVEGYRNFATKLWNATRFCQANGIGASQQHRRARRPSLPVNRWIIGEVVETLARLDKAMAELRFDAVADAIYHFAWDTFCDWYLELVKGAIDDETKAVAAWAFDQILVMLHPFMPFVTEELWHAHGRAAVRADRRQVAGAGGAARSRLPRARSAGWST